MSKSTKPLTAAERERLEWIMGSSGTMWSWWVDVERHGDNPDAPDSVTFTIENPSGDDDIVKTVPARSIVRAFGTAVRTVPSMAGMPSVECLDASSADCVLQIAVLGEVVYG